MLHFLSSSFDTLSPATFVDGAPTPAEATISTARDAGTREGLPRLLAADDALRLAASVLSDLRDFAVTHVCPDAERHIDDAIDAICARREQFMRDMRAWTSGELPPTAH